MQSTEVAPDLPNALRHCPQALCENKHKLVHLDLKGAPPKVSYLKELFPVLKKNGATGLLMEYEDSFPFSGPLRHLRKVPDKLFPDNEDVKSREPPANTQDRTEALDQSTWSVARLSCDGSIAAASGDDHPPYYLPEEIQEILACAQAHELEVVPLVQTFGHVEFILKHRAHQQLREVLMHPNALCPRHPQSLQLVQECVKQVLAAHPSAKHLHLGMDEVLIGACSRCQTTSRERVYLEWAVKVGGWLRRAYPHITPIIWDDMLRSMSQQELEASGIGTVVDLMIWKYDAGMLMLPDGYLSRLSHVFKGVWFASAYKGATGATQCLVPAQHHIDNHIAWLNVIREYGSLFQNSFKGFALTGWQRYDHYGVLCELLPAAVPSIVLCLQVLRAGEFTLPVHTAVSQALGFSSLVSLSPVPRPQLIESGLQFPGYRLYNALQSWANLCAMYNAHRSSEIVTGWYHSYRRRQKFVSPGVLEVVRTQNLRLLESLNEVECLLVRELLQVYDKNTVREWLQCFLVPLKRKLHKERKECQDLIRDIDTVACEAKTCLCSSSSSGVETK
ncbi:Glycoside hydrolase family 20 catalytic domain [Trinorchestia longiramus]|nr:Glycoside hydrolase family 20 catalytic domain [Trinorchestia longiramus]